MNFLNEPKDEPRPLDGKRRTKQIVQQLFRQLDTTLDRLQTVVKRHGREQIDAALGADAKELVKLYADLKALITKYRPGQKIADLPQ